MLFKDIIMLKYIFLFLLLLMAHQAANADPVILKCFASDGQQISDLTIDIEKKEMK